MSILFFILGFIAYLFGFYLLGTVAKNSIHEVVALLVILNGSVFFVGAGLMNVAEMLIAHVRNKDKGISR